MSTGLAERRLKSTKRDIVFEQFDIPQALATERKKVALYVTTTSGLCSAYIADSERNSERGGVSAYKLGSSDRQRYQLATER